MNEAEPEPNTSTPLSPLLKLKYNALADAMANLGQPE